MIPKEFFVASAKAVSPVSQLNAFDLALKNAGISQCNIVQSVLYCLKDARKENGV